VNNIGYKVFAGAKLLEKSSSTPVSIYTYNHIREDSNALFGFTSFDALEFFEQLITVQGVGPKVALNILDLAPLEKLKSAIQTKDQAFITSVPGIGKKTAAKIIIELSNKVTPSTVKAIPTQHVTQDVIDALESLGYSMNDIRPLLAQLEPSADVEKQVKKALSLLAKQKV